MKPRLVACNSGGRTSAHLTFRLLKEKSDEYEIVVLFANTGQEDEATLRFVHECDVQLGFNTVWLEAVPGGDNKRTGWKRVTYETASRNGEPYEAVIEKYGLPNQNFLHCTRELKEIPIHGYLWDELGWAKGDYLTAIGMRADEPRRNKPKKPDRQTKQNKVYPLSHWWPTDKEDVMDFWALMPFDLAIPEHRGNCTWCYKKSDQKLRRLWQEDKGDFDFPLRMEQTYGTVKAPEGEMRKMYRGNRSTADMLALFKLTGPTDEPVRQSAPGSCDEECSPFNGDDDD